MGKRALMFAGLTVPLLLVSLYLYSCNKGYESAERHQQTYFNMCAAQVAAESYARAHEGAFPGELSSDSVLSAYTAYVGTESKYPLQTRNGNILNPATDEPDWLVNEPVASREEAIAAAEKCSLGQVVYCLALKKSPPDYFILGKSLQAELVTNVSGRPYVLDHEDFTLRDPLPNHRAHF